MPRITPLPYQRLCRVFELAGFTLVRQEGDHRVYTKAGISRPIIMNNLHTANISRQEYFSLLEKA